MRLCRQAAYSGGRLAFRQAASISATSLTFRPITQTRHCGEPLIGRRHITWLSVADNAVQAGVQAITNLHTLTGTPWYLTIPLAALLVNLTCRLPFTYYGRLIQQRQAQLNPVLQAWVARINLDQVRQPDARVGTDRTVSRRYRSVERRIFRELGVQSWKTYSPFLVLPVWLTIIEAVKRLSGETRGLISSLVFGARMKDAGVVEAVAEETVPASAIDSADSVGELSAGTETLATLSSGADMTMSTGGCLWFTDLMAPDPLHILPVLLSISLVANIVPSTAAGRRRFFSLKMDENMPKIQTRFSRALLPIAALIGPWTMGLPSALHLFWLSSSVTTLIMTKAIHKAMPVDTKKIKPCQGRVTPVIPAQYVSR